MSRTCRISLLAFLVVLLQVLQTGASGGGPPDPLPRGPRPHSGPKSEALASSSFTVFGPENFLPVNGSKKATIFDRSFTVLDPSGTYTLTIYNGGPNMQFGRVSSAAVALNGALVVQPSEVKQHVAILEKSVTLQSSNTMQLQVAGNSGSAITVRIHGIDTVPPTISATASPPANAAGWNNTDVTVSFTCADARSGIASCPEPVTVTSEGGDQVVTGTAVPMRGTPPPPA